MHGIYLQKLLLCPYQVAQMPTMPPWYPCGSRERGGRPRPCWYKRTPEGRKEEGRMVEDTDVGDSVSIKTVRGRQWETTPLYFPRQCR